MKYRLPRPVIAEGLLGIIRREVRRQRIIVPRMSKNNLKELAEVTQEIEKWGCPKCFACKKLGGKLGHGIFLRADAEPIVKGQVIGSYAGEISIVPQNGSDDGAYSFAPLEHFLLSKSEQALLDKKSSFHPRRLYSLKLDAEKKGNFTRFINHSEKPNVYAEMFSVPANSYGLHRAPIEIVYMAKKTIHPGEQLLISYEAGEKSYWSAFNIKPFPMTPKTFQISSSCRLIRST